MKVVEIVWDDASNCPAWQKREAAVKEFHVEQCVCVTVGLLLKRDKRAITIAATAGAQGQVAGVWRIPMGMVKRVRTIATLKESGR